jgi:hypothetical protein
MSNAATATFGAQTGLPQQRELQAYHDLVASVRGNPAIKGPCFSG